MSVGISGSGWNGWISAFDLGTNDSPMIAFRILAYIMAVLLTAFTVLSAILLKRVSYYFAYNISNHSVANII